ncbi:MAG TPA: DNA-3-methyladenine glycosylase [Ktedonobacteraceae bacterium]
MILNQTFYAQETITVAKQLLGCFLVHQQGKETTLGRIVETEAYLWNDPAAHAFVGKTKRNSVLFGPVGHAYVYFIYGMHYCVNAVSGQAGKGEAVLIRALEPLQGIPVMQKRRQTEKLSVLCNGPARLTQALAITMSLNGSPLYDGELLIWSPDSLPATSPGETVEIVETTRIGISKAQELPLRFYLKGSRSISRK